MKFLTNRGFITTIVLIVIALIVLGFFGYNIRNIINQPTVQDNLNYVWDFVKDIWNRFLVGPATFIWDKLVVGIVWNGLVNLINQTQANNVPLVQ